MYDLISIGAATVDIFVKSEVFNVQKKLLTLPASSKSEINQSLFCSGGGATNSSVAFSRLGLKTACISLIGESHLNNFIFDDLKKNQVDHQFIIQNKKDITDFSIVLVAPDGSRSIFTNRGKSGLEEKHFKWNKIKDTKWFYITSLEGNLDLFEQIIGFAHENNIKVSFNPGKRELSQKRKILQLIKMTDFLLLNREEAETIIDTSHNHSQFWNYLHQLKAPLIGVTNGRQGAHILVDGLQYYSPIINTHAVDETGAGDSFGSAFVAALIYGHDPKEALFWGVKNSASVVSALGAKTALLTLKQIKK
jgi:ribokinase